MCPKKLCIALCLSISSLPVAFAGEHPSLSAEDTVSVDRTAEKPAAAVFSRIVKDRPVDAACFRLAVLPDAVLLRWKFENPGELSSAVLEESSNGLPFTTVAMLPRDAGAYTASVASSTSQYRIRMVSKDGTVVVSSVVNANGSVVAQ